MKNQEITQNIPEFDRNFGIYSNKFTCTDLGKFVRQNEIAHNACDHNVIFKGKKRKFKRQPKIFTNAIQFLKDIQRNLPVRISQVFSYYPMQNN